MRSLRLFFALWPSDEVRARIVRATSGSIRDAGGRPVPTANLHVTLLFLGETDARRLDALTSDAALVVARPFELFFDAIETWSRSRVLCLTCRQPPSAASDLALALETALAPRDSKRRDHAFRPHVTLARDARPVRETVIEPLDWRVSDFVLVESNMTKTGSQYSVIGRWPLRAA
jgi:2'-5' RNA ligase